MKTLTLKQPWASLVANDLKKYEFRSWKTNYRGKVLIHAGAGIDKEDMKRLSQYKLNYPSRRIIAEVEIIDCIKIDSTFNEKIKSMNSPIYGCKDRTGYAWVIGNCKLINYDVEVNGRLSFWEFDEAKLKDID